MSIDYINIFYPYNINYFAIHGGFKALNAYILALPPIKEVSLIIQNIWSLKRYMVY
jgi:hypothetical protein